MRLAELAHTVTSKNAGNFHLTFDVSFGDRETYERVRDSAVISTAAVAAALCVDEADVVSIIPFDPGQVVKINVLRVRASGDPGETDVFGAQQYPPLLNLDVPDQVLEGLPPR